MGRWVQTRSRNSDTSEVGMKGGFCAMSETSWGGRPVCTGGGSAAARGSATAGRLRDFERLPGLVVCCGLGGRGITWAPLLGELAAAQLCGAPLPMEGRLADALDPLRFALRAARRPHATARAPVADVAARFRS